MPEKKFHSDGNGICYLQRTSKPGCCLDDRMLILRRSGPCCQRLVYFHVCLDINQYLCDYVYIYLCPPILPLIATSFRQEV